MKNNELYQQKNAAKLSTLKDNFNKLKSEVSKSSLKIQLEMNYSFTWIGFLIDENNSILAELKKSNGKTSRLIKVGLENIWNDLDASMNDANAKLILI
jgi:hypothetical protein